MNDQAKQRHPVAFEAWCIAELMGHKRLAGRVTERHIAGAGWLQIEVPNTDGPGFKSNDLLSPKAIFRIRLCDEQTARAAAKAIGDTPPVQPWELQALTAGDTEDDDREDELDEADRENVRDIY